jgi:two-component system, OmpR family, response regulator
MLKILLVEDDDELAKHIVTWLTQESYTVERVASGTDGLFRLQQFDYDMTILDWKLPDLDGIEVCKRYRSDGGRMPVLMLTGKDSIVEKIAGLDAGADDYLTKPFHPDELTARLRALLRRLPLLSGETLKVGSIEIDRTKCKVTRDSEEIHLLPKEMAVLEFLMRHAGQVFNATAILNRVWASESEVSTDLVKVYIAKLRSKIDVPGAPSLIKTVHGLGYKFDASDAPQS